MMRRFAPLFVLLLAACSSNSFLSYLPTPYKVTVQQGNVITQEMVSKLRPGMTRAQVRFVLGTPPIDDVFHANRWDYVSSVRHVPKGAKESPDRKLSLFFENDLLVRVAGDVVAETTQDREAAQDKPAAAPKEIVIEKFDPSKPPIPPEDEKGFIGRMLESVGL